MGWDQSDCYIKVPFLDLKMYALFKAILKSSKYHKSFINMYVNMFTYIFIYVGVYIYIVINRQTVSLYHNSLVCLDT